VPATPAKQHEHIAACERLVEKLSERTGLAWTFGYIGNTGPGYDDRSWFAFAPHPGRIGTSADRLGGFPTEHLDRLRVFLAGAVAALRFTEAHPMAATYCLDCDAKITAADALATPINGGTVCGKCAIAREDDAARWDSQPEATR
jgi:hypothetical protein